MSWDREDAFRFHKAKLNEESASKNCLRLWYSVQDSLGDGKLYPYKIQTNFWEKIKPKEVPIFATFLHVNTKRMSPDEKVDTVKKVFQFLYDRDLPDFDTIRPLISRKLAEFSRPKGMEEYGQKYYSFNVKSNRFEWLNGSSRYYVNSQFRCEDVISDFKKKVSQSKDSVAAPNSAKETAHRSELNSEEAHIHSTPSTVALPVTENSVLSSHMRSSDSVGSLPLGPSLNMDNLGEENNAEKENRVKDYYQAGAADSPSATDDVTDSPPLILLSTPSEHNQPAEPLSVVQLANLPSTSSEISVTISVNNEDKTSPSCQASASLTGQCLNLNVCGESNSDDGLIKLSVPGESGVTSVDPISLSPAGTNDCADRDTVHCVDACVKSADDIRVPCSPFPSKLGKLKPIDIGTFDLGFSLDDIPDVIVITPQTSEGLSADTPLTDPRSASNNQHISPVENVESVLANNQASGSVPLSDAITISSGSSDEDVLIIREEPGRRRRKLERSLSPPEFPKFDEVSTDEAADTSVSLSGSCPSSKDELDSDSDWKPSDSEQEKDSPLSRKSSQWKRSRLRRKCRHDLNETL